MNRLITIGNGFDIAHGMPTKYSDFIKWYLIKLFRKLATDNFEDEALSAYRNDDPNKQIDFLIYSKIATEKVKNFKDTDSYLNELLNNKYLPNNYNHIHAFAFDFKFPFLKDICLFYAEKNWVDIENLFYKKLLALSSIDEKNENRNIAVDLLNRGMDYLKRKLEEYLFTITLPEINHKISNIFNSEICLKYMTKNKKDERTVIPNQIVFLNFNYTKTISKYLGCINRKTTTTNNLHIHGELKNNKNPLIFGFGDEMDDHYKVLEKTNYNGFLDNVKSFGYFETGNYQEVTSFINSDEAFEVFVMGHSCGLSDRVMLNMIFEHHNCKSIKIFYYDDGKNNNYKTLTQEISRHFNKKNDMRLKIVPFEDSIPLPQLS